MSSGYQRLPHPQRVVADPVGIRLKPRGSNRRRRSTTPRRAITASTIGPIDGPAGCEQTTTAGDFEAMAIVPEQVVKDRLSRTAPGSRLTSTHPVSGPHRLDDDLPRPPVRIRRPPIRTNWATEWGRRCQGRDVHPEPSCHNMNKITDCCSSISGSGRLSNRGIRSEATVPPVFSTITAVVAAVVPSSHPVGHHRCGGDHRCGAAHRSQDSAPTRSSCS